MKDPILVTGGFGFIGSAVARRLLREGHVVHVVDIHGPLPDHTSICSDYYIGDLRDPGVCTQVVRGCKTVLHFAANMGGMGAIHDANDFVIYKDNHLMTLHLLSACIDSAVECFFYASSACVYASTAPLNGDISLREGDVWSKGSHPDPQGLYGLDKLNAELILSHFSHKLSIRIARFHNIFGPGGAWFNGREKAPAAFLRKAFVAKAAADAGSRPRFEIWGDGSQRRSFLYIDDCVEGILALLRSDYTEPVNIGSDQAVTINALAHLALDCAKLMPDDVSFEYQTGRPLGVAARNSNNDTALQVLHPWRPCVSQEEGMRRTGVWVADQLDTLLQRHDNAEILNRLGSSTVVNLRTAVTFAILLPITSRGTNSESECLDNLRCFADSLMRTTYRDVFLPDAETTFGIKIILAIDYDDTFLVKENKAEAILRFLGFDVTTIICHQPRGHVCSLWRHCARTAYSDPTITYFVLMGDDVEILDEGWMAKIHSSFISISQEHRTPLGFGCVAFRDLSFPGMPTFPVVHRTHLDIFNGEVIPEIFVNQDGDPFLFQLYRRWGCSYMLKDVTLRNSLGGSEDARYAKLRTPSWSFQTLDRAIDVARQWLQVRSPGVQSKLAVDVVVPSFRVDIPLLERILALRPSPMATTMFIIIIDDPRSSAIDVLQKKYGHRVDVRIRVNDSNLGASASRNRGMDESSADWIIYLDDDIEPNSDLIPRAEAHIRAHPNAAGFVGNVHFPPPDSVFTSAVHLSGVTYFWNIAEKIKNDLPWGVTANLISRRVNDGVQFDLRFPKTGGGEDIDFCARKKETNPAGEGFYSAPDVIVTHPWWSNGHRSYWRFYGWGFGDSSLVGMYPQFVSWDYAPNSAELLLCATFISTSGMVLRHLAPVWMGLKLAVVVVLINLLHDLYRRLWAEPFDEASMPAKRGERHLVQGCARIVAILESTLIRMSSEAGKTAGLIKQGQWYYLGKRFDWFTGRWGDGPKRNERKNSLQRFVLVVLIYFAWINM
ncbi:glycosyltransferase family 2 protein [Guyanagaster necrorhizus]|uniref:Glycosyltransferase family 2 protein n=1 Tax=Guyanagaster necrorhizus TaxID=856835 RepID=A0A9P7VL80_9AGAR|nr:glycosyltransferase family 2 protein [Guyanagaster necrorhizus MCA 3950]KAG7442613.1 glycosyltransferase family 2 protein [Guyanagaster necrorhizus MCA 3950]